MTKKELGQHWLHDEGVLQAIAEVAELSENDTVLEIGPGLGTLTRVLVASGATVQALEYDPDLIPKIVNFLARAKKFTIVQGDIRSFDLQSLPQDYKIVANIPYYLTSHLIRQLSESPNKPLRAVLLMQKEVARRICAEPGQMSLLSVVAQLEFECLLGIEVPAALFTPPPKVDSQVLVMQRRPAALFNVDQTAFLQLVKAGFSEKRKKLVNSLSGGLLMPKQAALELLRTADVSADARAQELSLAKWHDLYQAYRAMSGNS